MRVLVVFRSFVLLVTIILMPSREYTLLVAATSLLAVALSYVLLKHWARIGPSVSRHPAYLAVELMLATLILGAAGARSPFFFFTLGTAALAGVVYGRRGALPFSAVLIALYELVALEGFPTMRPLHDLQSVIFVPLLYPVAVLAGVAAQELVARGVELDALLRERTEALVAEQERLSVARELHDSLAKTVEGLAMTASVLPRRCERDPAGAAALARGLVDDARQAALEARVLMSGLRSDTETTFVEALRRRATMLGERSGIAVRVVCETPEHSDAIPATAQHELLRILGEAVINGVRHGAARSVTVSVAQTAGELRLSVADDGCGLAMPVDFDALKAEGHFGLAGMRERAEAIGGELIADNGARGGATLAVRVPLGAAQAPGDGSDSHPRRGPFRRARGPAPAAATGSLRE